MSSGMGRILACTAWLVVACGGDDDARPIDATPPIDADAAPPERDAHTDAEPARDAGDEPDTGPARPSIETRVRLDEVVLTQGVEISLERAGVAVTEPNAPVVEHRAGLLRVLLTPLDGSIALHATMTIEDGASSSDVEIDLDLARPSDRGELGTTLDLPLAPERVTAGATLSIAIASTSTTGELRWPADGIPYALGAQSTLRPLRVALVPIVSAAGTPVFPPEDLLRLRTRLLDLLPISELELDVLETPITYDGDVCAFAAWQELIALVRARRAADAPADGVYYGGMVAIDDFRCATVGGVAGGTDNAIDDVAARAFVATTHHAESMRDAETAVAHELGHALGRRHAPCGTEGELEFPYPDGHIGVWGWSAARDRLFDPSLYTDFMSYCSPQWTSDYTYARLFERIRAVHEIERP